MYENIEQITSYLIILALIKDQPRTHSCNTMFFVYEHAQYGHIMDPKSMQEMEWEIGNN